MSTKFSLERQSGQIPEGVHIFQIIEFEEKEGPKAPYIQFTLECNAQGEIWDAQKVWLNISLSPSARWKMDEFLDAMEADGKGEATAREFLGKGFKAYIKHEPYTDQNGITRTTPNVSQLLPLHSDDVGLPKPKVDVSKLAKKKKTEPEPDLGGAVLPLDAVEDEDIPF